MSKLKISFGECGQQIHHPSQQLLLHRGLLNCQLPITSNSSPTAASYIYIVIYTNAPRHSKLKILPGSPKRFSNSALHCYEVMACNQLIVKMKNLNYLNYVYNSTTVRLVKIKCIGKNPELFCTSLRLSHPFGER